MKPRTSKRIDRVKDAITSLPVRKKVLDEEFEYFEMFGELPEEHHVAVAVVQRAIGQDFGASDVASWAKGTPPAPTVREHLFHEALFSDSPPHTRLAQAGIAVEVARGGKVTDPRFASHHGFPDHGSIAMHLAGYPQRLAVAPYVEQAHRLFARYRALRDNIDYGDPDWYEPYADAIMGFNTTGEIPAEGPYRDYVLSEAEMAALRQHSKGGEVSELMAAFDAAARAGSDEREAAVAEIVTILGSKSGPLRTGN